MKNSDGQLRIDGLSAGYNAAKILTNVHLSVMPGEICCVIGEEGAGKSTLVKAITRQIRSTGEISFGAIDLTSVPTSQMISHGVDFLMQGGNILNGFTVEEHIQLALPGKSAASHNEDVWYEINTRFPRIVKLRKQMAGRLSGGERMILSMACILASDARLLLLDEPTAGLSMQTCDAIGDFLLYLQKEKSKTILLLEHNYEFSVEVATSIVTLKGGQLSRKFQKDDFQQESFIHSKLYASLS